MNTIHEDKLRAFGRLIVRLQEGGSLSREEAREAYTQIWRNEQPELHQGAFIAALRQKGETRDELIGVTESFNQEWARFFPHVVRAPEPHLGLCGMGMDSLKTVNISSGAAVIAAACGVYVHKVGGPPLTGISGCSDVFARWGVDPDVPGEQSVRVTEQCRLGFTSIVGKAFQHSGIARVVSQLRMATSIHFAGPLGVHIGERHKVMGVPHPKFARLVCEAMRELGYKRALVPCGGSTEHPGAYIDELSNIGPTFIAELGEDGRIAEYELHPGDAGLKEARYADIATAGTREENSRIVVQALAGQRQGPVLEVLALNAAACLQVMGKVTSLASGVEQALQAVAQGRALGQLRALIETQNQEPSQGLTRLGELLES